MTVALIILYVALALLTLPVGLALLFLCAWLDALTKAAKPVRMIMPRPPRR